MFQAGFNLGSWKDQRREGRVEGSWLSALPSELWWRDCCCPSCPQLGGSGRSAQDLMLLQSHHNGPTFSRCLPDLADQNYPRVKGVWEVVPRIWSSLIWGDYREAWEWNQAPATCTVTYLSLAPWQPNASSHTYTFPNGYNSTIKLL